MLQEDDLLAQERPVDVVQAPHVLEQLDEPVAALLRLAGLLRGASLFLEPGLLGALRASLVEAIDLIRRISLIDDGAYACCAALSPSTIAELNSDAIARGRQPPCDATYSPASSGPAAP